MTRRCHGPRDAWCGSRPSLECEFEHLAERDHDGWVRLLDSHAFICPDTVVLRLLANEGPIVELGAGRGYWARLLRDLGCDVVALDNGSWGLTAGMWSDVHVGDESSLSAFAERTLLMVKPARPGSGRLIEAWSGRRMVIVTDGAYPNLMSLADGDAETALSEGGWVEERRHGLTDPFMSWPVAAHFFARA